MRRAHSIISRDLGLLRFTAAAAAILTVSLCLASDRPNLAFNGSFEENVGAFSGWIPTGVVPEKGEFGISIVEGTARTGKKSLRITPGPSEAVSGIRYVPGHNGDETKRKARADHGVRGARTFAMRVGPDIESASAQIWVLRSDESPLKLSAIWTSRKNRRPTVEIARHTTATRTKRDGDWELFTLTAKRPQQAHQLQICIETGGLKPLHIDDVRLTLHRKPQIQLLVDQLGFEPDSKTKTILMQSSTPLSDVPPARLISLTTGKTVRQQAWDAHGIIPSWDLYHWKADFSDISQPGRYVVSIERRGKTITSPAFEIAKDILPIHTARLAYRFFYYQRCGMAIPGFHAACHLDDAILSDGTQRNLSGGWHDAGDYNKYNGLTPEAVHMLAFAYHQKPELYARWDTDRNKLPDILDEARWGVRFVRKMLDADRLELLNAVSSGYRYWGPPEKETDNRPNTGDERPVTKGRGNPSHLVAGFALLGHALRDSKNKEATREGIELIDLAERLYVKLGGGLDRLVPLFLATGKDDYRKAARRRAEQLLQNQKAGHVSGFRELALYAITFPDDPLSMKIKPLAKRRADELAANCDKRFGLFCHRDSGGKLIYIRAYNKPNDWYVGGTSDRLDAAIDALYAARLGATRGKDIAENQIHWLLGRNPFGLSLMEGVGSRFLPLYHHRYNAIPGNPRGAVPGALVNGIIRAWPHVDRPWLDLHPEPNPDYHSNEPWLLHNNRWLMVVALW